MYFSAMHCGNLTAPINGTFEWVENFFPAFATNSIAEFSCNDGYKIADGQEYSLICLQNGTWSSPIPTCVEDICETGKIL